VVVVVVVVVVVGVVAVVVVLLLLVVVMVLVLVLLVVVAVVVGAVAVVLPSPRRILLAPQPPALHLLRSIVTSLSLQVLLCRPSRRRPSLQRRCPQRLLASPAQRSPSSWSLSQRCSSTRPLLAVRRRFDPRSRRW
jgi:hypothetical protein